MKVYHFRADDGEFTGESICEPDPMEPGRWLVPAWSTPDAPPAAVEGKRRCYLIPGTDVAPATHQGQGGAWELRDLPPADAEA